MVKKYRKKFRPRRRFKRRFIKRYHRRPRILFSKPFPYNVNKVLKLASEFIEINPAATTVAKVFALNDIYNPLGAHSNNQPYFYDDLNVMYNYYRVYYSVWWITFINEQSDPLRIGICFSQDVGAPSSARNAAEQNDGRQLLLTAANGAANKKTIRVVCKSNKFLKGSSIAGQTALFGASPASRIYLHMYYESESYDGAPANIASGIVVNARFYTKIFAFDKPGSSEL